MKSEADTRKQIIDQKLKSAGWNINNRSQVIPEYDISVALPEGVAEPQSEYQGHQFSDYVLLGKDGNPLAVVEAKKTSKDAETGREQENQKEKFETLKENLVEIISELPLSVNIVAKEEELIRKAQSNHYWSKISDNDFDTLSEKLSPLMKFRDGKVNTIGPASLDLIDLVKTKEMVEFGPEHEAVSISRYKEMVEKMILELTQSNPVLQKIKNGSPVTEEEARELSEVLLAEHPHITEKLLQNVYQNRKARFLQFIRHILGLEVLESFPDSVSHAFEQFIQAHSNLSSRQLDFLNLLKDFIIERESISKRNLIESPFTRLHPDGIRGLFSPSEIDEILALTRKVAS